MQWKYSVYWKVIATEQQAEKYQFTEQLTSNSLNDASQTNLFLQLHESYKSLRLLPKGNKDKQAYWTTTIKWKWKQEQFIQQIWLVPERMSWLVRENAFKTIVCFINRSLGYFEYCHK